MNKEIKTKWVEKLRSGKYKQGQGRLREEDSFCCLGVLCDLYAKETGLGWSFHPISIFGSEKNIGNFLGENHFLPPSVITWAGLEDRKGTLPFDEHREGQRTLADYNDEGYNFEEIADIIENEF